MGLIVINSAIATSRAEKDTRNFEVLVAVKDLSLPPPPPPIPPRIIVYLPFSSNYSCPNCSNLLIIPPLHPPTPPPPLN